MYRAWRESRWFCRIMSIHWLTIFLVLADFILINSNGLPTNEPGVETRQIPTYMSHQETMDHRYNGNEKMSSEKKDYQRMISALSKIAKVYTSEGDSAIVRRGLAKNIYDVTRKKHKHSSQNTVAMKDTDGLTLFNTKLSSLPSNDIFHNANSEKGQGNFHCQAIRDVYIPEIKENIPSYACTLGNKTFILASKRFFQDRRSSLRVNVDDDMIRKLNRAIIDAMIAPINNKLNVIPAVLVLKPGHENYDIRNQ